MCEIVNKPLTTKQLEVIEIMVEHKDWTNKQIAEEAGIHYNSITKWTRMPVFREELDKRLHEVFKDGARIALKTMLDLAISGDYKAAAYLLDNGGYKAADKQEVAIGTSNTIKINIE